MHELSITQSLFDLVLEQAKRAGAAKVTRINLVIGRLTGVVGDSVRFYMDFLSQDTIVQGAGLEIKEVPARVTCRDCGQESELREFDWTCPGCGGTSLAITGGKELFLESIDVER